MFEFDPAKSSANRVKHGIDFVAAQQLWEGQTVSFVSPRTEESRTVVVGVINGKFWSAIITYRHEKIRIISVRRSRQDERQQWQDHYQPGRHPDHQP